MEDNKKHKNQNQKEEKQETKENKEKIFEMNLENEIRKEEKPLSIEEQLEIKLQEKEEEIKVLNEKILLLHADFTNFKARNEILTKQIMNDKEERFLKDFLIVLDTIERAISMYKDENVIEGYSKVKKQFQETLSKYGVNEMITDGQKFDPNFHDAVLQKHEEGIESNIILHTAKKGYMINDRVLRHAEVIVSE